MSNQLSIFVTWSCSAFALIPR